MNGVTGMTLFVAIKTVTSRGRHLVQEITIYNTTVLISIIKQRGGGYNTSHFP